MKLTVIIFISISRDDDNMECVDPQTSYTVPEYTYNANATCSCNDYKYLCTEGSATPPPRQRITTTGDTVQNLDGRNTENYLFESFDEFINKRFVKKYCWVSEYSNNTNEPRHDKTCFCLMQTTKTQLSLRIRVVWSASLSFAA